ncbi:hypothetical protein Avbf_05708 [Armadillidium vulgare]|nr:hypothetical protein Avbf_05708 [Armadillidium vulgare]
MKYVLPIGQIFSNFAPKTNRISKPEKGKMESNFNLKNLALLNKLLLLNDDYTKENIKQKKFEERKDEEVAIPNLFSDDNLFIEMGKAYSTNQCK